MKAHNIARKWYNSQHNTEKENSGNNQHNTGLSERRINTDKC